MCAILYRIHLYKNVSKIIWKSNHVSSIYGWKKYDLLPLKSSKIYDSSLLKAQKSVTLLGIFAAIPCDNFWLLLLNPSSTKPFGTHTFYQAGGGGRGGGERVRRTPCYLKNRYPHEHEILYGIRGIFERPRNFNVSYIVMKLVPYSNSSNIMCFYQGNC